jgi:hypothetical protein
MYRTLDAGHSDGAAAMCKKSGLFRPALAGARNGSFTTKGRMPDCCDRPAAGRIHFKYIANRAPRVRMQCHEKKAGEMKCNEIEPIGQSGRNFLCD